MVTRIPLKSKEQTGNAMYNLCSRFYSDLDCIYYKKSRFSKEVPLSSLSLQDYYDYVRKIPYKIDKKPVEVIGRPLQIVKLPQLDCKKKAIMIGSYAAYHDIPFRFIASSCRRDRKIHHVYPELYIDGEWVNFDGTYREYFIGKVKRTTAKEIL